MSAVVDIGLVSDNNHHQLNNNNDHIDDEDNQSSSTTIGRQSTSAINWSSLLNLADDPELAELLSSAVDSAARILRLV
jgi:hypothetical protein